MKRPVVATKTPETPRRKHPLKELWKRLTTDDLDDVRGGGEVTPISGGRPHG